MRMTLRFFFAPYYLYNNIYTIILLYVYLLIYADRQQCLLFRPNRIEKYETAIYFVAHQLLLAEQNDQILTVRERGLLI